MGAAANKNNFILMNQMVGTGVIGADPCSLLPKPKVRTQSHTLYLCLLTQGQCALKPDRPRDPSGHWTMNMVGHRSIFFLGKIGQGGRFIPSGLKKTSLRQKTF